MCELTWDDFLKAKKQLDDYYKSKGIDPYSIECTYGLDLANQIEKLVEQMIEAVEPVTYRGIKIRISENKNG